MNEALNPYTCDLHQHSWNSDGLSRPLDHVIRATRRGIHIIGGSDHDTVEQWKEYLDAYYALEPKTSDHLFIPTVEISTREGHVLVSIPRPQDTERYVADFRYPWPRPYARDVIPKVVEDYHGICIFAHPQKSRINGMSIKNIGETLHDVPQSMHPNLGIERYSWMSEAFFWSTVAVERDVEAANREWKLAEFGASDAHMAKDIGKGETVVYMSSLSPDGFVQAVQKRWTIAQMPDRTVAGYVDVMTSAAIIYVWGEKLPLNLNNQRMRAAMHEKV